ncbi:MFS transporter [Listeria seeligeri]|uniref:MFS transporter n=1 Tax=Listeria seeligeri TaxID=1640 RepID=A0ABR5E753_LISSE|nr:MFS transporter [Listeria seeligeri]KKD45633.1 MFS transporter [Listeria seeligeri]MBC1576921.1 MFS transporter [Listeria seeligeri]MBC1592306.1 MFS transporter [Listeria seeligeri]MBC1915147.1 MFS transporter [Listeria seeligeri]MBC1988402.1 MFS transporter [Listeria seeligeri]
MDNKKVNPSLTLLALAISAFGIGSTEFISVGLLPLISSNMDVSISTAGLTVSIYALGVMVGAPVLTTMTAKMNRKNLLMLVMVVFIIGNLISAFAASFAILLTGRVIAAFAHGVFMSIASVIAADVVQPSKRASAIAVMFTGLTVATVTGVPLGTFIGQLFGWRMSFIFIVAIGVIALIANYFLVPKNLSSAKSISLKSIGQVLLNKKIGIVLLMTAFGYGGTFVVYTYLSPMFIKMGYTANMIVVLLIIYGIMVAIGNTIGGHFANEKPAKALFVMFSLQAATLLLLQFTSPNPILGLIVVMLMGFFAFMSVSGLQLYVVELAERYLPETVSMASALNISAFNVGIAMGAFIGGLITEYIGLSYTPIVGFLMVLIAIILSYYMKKEK